MDNIFTAEAQAEIQEILARGNDAEIKQTRKGILIVEIRRKVKMTLQQGSGDSQQGL